VTDIARGDLAALARQANAIRSFARAATDAVQDADRAAERCVRRILEGLARRRAALVHANAELSACQRDEGQSCDAQAQAVQREAAFVQSAEQALRIAERAQASFQAPKARFIREVSALEEDGAKLLSSMSSDLETYLARTATDGSAAGQPSDSGPSSSAGLPDGWEMVPMSAIDDSESGVSGPESFAKGYSPDDLTWGLDALCEVVLPAMRQGKGLDYFQGRDQAEGRIGSRSYTDTYLGFFGDSAIKFESRGNGSYGVGNGYHRIWVAKRLGLRALPGRVR
jgi:hypothetical protein